MHALLVLAIVQHHVKAAGHGNDELMQPLVGMPTALCPTGHVVKVIDALDVKGDVAATLDEGQVAAGIRDLGERHHLTGIDIERHSAAFELA